jgi:hypothetical protein
MGQDFFKNLKLRQQNTDQWYLRPANTHLILSMVILGEMSLGKYIRSNETGSAITSPVEPMSAMV